MTAPVQAPPLTAQRTLVEDSELKEIREKAYKGVKAGYLIKPAADLPIKAALSLIEKRNVKDPATCFESATTEGFARLRIEYHNKFPANKDNQKIFIPSVMKGCEPKK